jgi:hypothetical protein
MKCSCRPSEGCISLGRVRLDRLLAPTHALPSGLATPFRSGCRQGTDLTLDKRKDALIEPKDQRVRRRMLGLSGLQNPSPFQVSCPAGRAAVTVAPWT